MPDAPTLPASLAPGSRLDGYEIVGPLGTGGMGEVYRARDTRLGREVALKVLPEIASYSPERRARFEREARAVAALSHPNVLTIFDFGTWEGRAYAVMELLEGETLRERLRAGPLPVRKALDYGSQIARGLAAAHEKGIVHRDLKPENVMILPDGRIKVLDFGLARLAMEGVLADANSETHVPRTDPGTIMGTAGYMSPEQVRGEHIDRRTDVFAFGCVLHEMLTGTRAFRRDTSVETLSAILKEEPAQLARTDTQIPPAVANIVHHCLEKSPAERFQSASDLAFDLESALGESVVGARALVGGARRRVALPLAAGIAVLALAAGLAAGIWVGRSRGGPDGPAEPTFTRLTYGRGMIRSARFAPDGKTVVFGAAWDGQPTRLFLTRTDTAESTPIGLPDAEVLAVSAGGELALSLGHRYEGWMGEGTLARAPLLGGAARAMLEAVREAEWTPDGTRLAVVRRTGGRESVEFPLGTPIYETGGYVSHLRFSPDGSRLAFADHPLFADDVGYVAIMDTSGTVRRLTGFWGAGLRSLAWSPGGDEIWFTASRAGENAALRAVDLSGRQRHLLGGLTHMVIFDALPDGRLLLGRETYLRTVEALMAGESKPRDVSLAREGSAGKQITADGRTLLITDQYADNYATYLRRADQASPVRLGQGEAMHLSPDGQWVIAVTPETPSRLLLHPIGPGQTRQLPNSGGIVIEAARWLPDGQHIVMLGRSRQGRSRGYLVAVGGGSPRAFTPEGVEPVRWWTMPVSPDGKRVVARGPDGRIFAYPVDGSPAQEIPGIADPDIPLEWTADGKAIFIGRQDAGTWRVRRLEMATGRETPWMEVSPPEVAGLRVSQLFLTADGRYYVHSYSRLLTDLYVADGIR
jgi:Tol biopolymer transport system component